MSSPGLVASMPVAGVFAGIDWGNAHHQLCVLDSTGTVLRQRRFTHDVEGLRDLSRCLGEFTEVVGVAIERAEGLLVEHLHEQGHRLFCISPKIERAFPVDHCIRSVRSPRFPGSSSLTEQIGGG